MFIVLVLTSTAGDRIHYIALYIHFWLPIADVEAVKYISFFCPRSPDRLTIIYLMSGVRRVRGAIIVKRMET